jgi:hypothetical protein
MSKGKTMRSAIAVTLTARRSNRPLHGCVARIAFGAFAVVGILAATTRDVEAQTGPEPHRTWELIVPSGTVIPTGTQREAIKRGGLTAVQLAYVVDPSLALTAMVGWVRSRDIASAGDPKLDLFTYDVGAELRAPRWLSSGLFSFSPFAGGGAGARSYNYRSLDVDARHNLAAYGSIGGEVGVGRVHLRVEARDYVTGFKPLDGTGSTDARNDVALMFGFRFGTR